MSRISVKAVGLAVLYVLTLTSRDPVDLLIGAALGAVLVTVLGRRLPLDVAGGGPPVLQRVIWLGPFLLAVLVDIVQGTVDVALRVVHLRRLDRPGLIRVPLGARTERGVAISALTTTLSPGTVLIDVDWERREMLLHVIDASDPDGVRDRLQRFYDRYQRRVFP